MYISEQYLNEFLKGKYSYIHIDLIKIYNEYLSNIRNCVRYYDENNQGDNELHFFIIEHGHISIPVTTKMEYGSFVQNLPIFSIRKRDTYKDSGFHSVYFEHNIPITKFALCTALNDQKLLMNCLKFINNTNIDELYNGYFWDRDYCIGSYDYIKKDIKYSLNQYKQMIIEFKRKM